jgi:hypothetical protein
MVFHPQRMRIRDATHGRDAPICNLLEASCIDLLMNLAIRNHFSWMRHLSVL